MYVCKQYLSIESLIEVLFLLIHALLILNHARVGIRQVSKYVCMCPYLTDPHDPTGQLNVLRPGSLRPTQ